jgi:hypothetical protein
MWRCRGFRLFPCGEVMAAIVSLKKKILVFLGLSGRK